MVSPIQIVLNPDNFHEARETGGGGPGKDFLRIGISSLPNTNTISPINYKQLLSILSLNPRQISASSR